MKRKSFLLILLFALTGIRCFGLDATFLKAHNCVHIDGASHCTAHWSDTVSGFARAFYGNGMLHEAIKEATPQIVDVNKIYMGETIIIPDAPSNSTIAAAPAAAHVQSHVKASSATATVNLVNLQQVHPTMTTTEPAPKFSATTFPEEMNIASLAVFQPTATPKVVLMQVATTQSVTPPPAPLPTSKETAKARPTKIVETVGYKYLMTPNFAASKGIILGVPLETHYFLYNSEGNPVGYIRLKKNSWAQQEGKNIALYVPLGKLPGQRFNLLVGKGAKDLIDGDSFESAAQPVQGKLPGPHHGMRTVFTALLYGGNGYMLACTLGPIAGPAVMGGVILTKALLIHHANTGVLNAEKEFNARLAEGNTPSHKEVGQ